jgi:asparagine synthase (glutamine-hydrolysing)
MKNCIPKVKMLVEGNGGDDCFGFPDLVTQSKWQYKSRFPKFGKDFISFLMKDANSWKWEASPGLLARVLALCDVHEIDPINYFLVLTPVNFLGLNIDRSWDIKLNEIMQKVFSNVSRDNTKLSYEAQVTVRQLMHVNSRRWAAKAHSVGESLGIKIVYPYIWRDILIEQGRIPWQVKVHQGIVKWPLKRLLEEYMPHDFIYRPKSGFVPPFAHWLSSKNFNEITRQILLSSDANVGRLISPKIMGKLLDDALLGKKLRHAVLNFLWGALFTEMWIRKYKDSSKIL